MNRTLWSLVLLLILGSSSACAEGDPTLILGISRNMSTVYEGTSGTSGAAVHYGVTTMKAYQGCTITELRVDLGAASGTDSIRAFVASSLTGQPLAEQRFTSTGAGWATIVFDQPYTVTGEAVYIGYEMQGLKTMRYSTALVPGEEWVRKRDSDWQRYKGDNAASFYAIVTGENLPQHNICLRQSVLPEYAQTGKALTLGGDIINLGTEAVTDVTVSLVANGETVGTQTISGLRVKNRRLGTFSLDGLTLPAAGDYELQLVVTAVNGEADADPSDNTSRTVSVLCRDTFTARRTLMEVFSTERCTNCPTAHDNIEQSLADKTDIIEVGHHAGFYTDWLTVDASTDYEWFYRKGNLHAPALMFDRTSHFDNYPEIYTDTVPVTDVGNLATLYAAATAVPALATVDLQTSYDQAARTLSVSVSGEQLLPISQPDSIRLNVWLTEDSIFSTSQAGSGGTFYHRHALRRLLTPTWGETYSLDDAGTRTYTTTIDTEWNASRMSVVAFLANYDSTDKYNCRVLNAARVAVDPTAAGIEKLGDDATPMPTGYYSVTGVKADKPQKGLNLVRMSDGTVRKQLFR